jgi:hypothetical protein
MALESRISMEATVEEALKLAVAELGPPKKVKTRRKYRPYMKTYKRKLTSLTAIKLWGLRHTKILAGKHFVCESCGTKEGYYHAMGRSVIKVEPLSVG